MCKSLEYADELFNLAEEVRLNWKDLHNRLSIADQKKNDVEHFIEINPNLNASQGYSAYRLLKDVLEERRDIKNKIDELKPMLDFVNASQLTNPVKKDKLYQSITARRDNNRNESENKVYRVRILTDVFGDVIK